MSPRDLADAWQSALGPPDRRVDSEPGQSPREIWLYWFRDRRYAAVICDEDGDTVVLLSDRDSDLPAQAEDITLEGAEHVAAKLRRFLAGERVRLQDAVTA